jgi:6-pyruvoyltetrahydropterin/6-carboxytetrahydropterin synthase
MTYFALTKVEFDAGHRVPDHASKCRNPHGHRYVVEASVGSKELETTGSETGMVADFGNIKALLIDKVHDVLDHGFIVYEGDVVLLTAFNMYDETNISELGSSDYGWKVIVFPYVPTAENIARWAFEQIEDDVKRMSTTDHDVWLDAVIVHETPNCKAIYHGPYDDNKS